MYARTVYEQLEALYQGCYGHPSVANNFEIHAILGVVSDPLDIIEKMHDRRGQPSARYEMLFEHLPRIKQEEGVQGKALKTWDKFSWEVRGEAIKRLGDRGIWVWQANFDAHTREVRELCQSIEDGTVLNVKPEKGMYQFMGMHGYYNPRGRFDFGAGMF